VRSGIAQIESTKDIEVSVEDKFVRFKFEAKRTSLQDLIKAIQGKDGRFSARLALLVSPADPPPDVFERARLAVAGVEGARALSSPGKDGIALATFDLEKKTMLPDVIAAARGAGLTLKDPPAKK
jgi:hypothetical protein